MTRNVKLTLVVDVVLIVAAVLAAFSGGWRVFFLLLIPWLLWDIGRTLRPSRGRIPVDLGRPGGFRVILQVPGPRPILVVREVRRATGRDLVAAKKVVDDWPSIVVEGLSEESAAKVADRLRRAGATALAAPIGENL